MKANWQAITMSRMEEAADKLTSPLGECILGIVYLTSAVISFWSCEQ